MNKKKIKKLLFSLLSILIVGGLIAYLVIRQHKLDNRPFKKIEFKESIKIINETNYSKLDTILYVAIDSIHHIDSAVVYCFELTSSIKDNLTKNSEIDLYAFVEPITLNSKNHFKLFIKSGLNLDGLKRVLSHESIHINQYYTGKFKKYNKAFIFNNHIYTIDDIHNMTYKQRPWETEAFEGQENVKHQLEKILY